MGFGYTINGVNFLISEKSSFFFIRYENGVKTPFYKIGHAYGIAFNFSLPK